MKPTYKALERANEEIICDQFQSKWAIVGRDAIYCFSEIRSDMQKSHKSESIERKTSDRRTWARSRFRNSAQGQSELKEKLNIGAGVSIQRFISLRLSFFSHDAVDFHTMIDQQFVSRGTARNGRPIGRNKLINRNKVSKCCTRRDVIGIWFMTACFCCFHYANANVQNVRRHESFCCWQRKVSS